MARGLPWGRLAPNQNAIHPFLKDGIGSKRPLKGRGTLHKAARNKGIALQPKSS